MSATGYTPISLYYSTTASATPSAANLANGELAININTADGKLYYKDSAGSVQLLASKAGASGSVTSVAQSFTGGLISVSGSPITTSGTLALTVAGTSGGVPYFSSASAWASSAALAANAIVLGGGGFIGYHVVNRLKNEGYWVRAVDLKYPEFAETQADEFVVQESERFFMRISFTGSCNEEEVKSELINLLPQDVKVEILPPRIKKVVVMVTKEHHCLGDLLIKNQFQDLPFTIQAVIGNHEILKPICTQFSIPFYWLAIRCTCGGRC